MAVAETLDVLRSNLNARLVGGSKPCFIPVRSPQSNGMAEAFVHRFKRDYVQSGPLREPFSS